jgi:hypothetical protein
MLIIGVDYHPSDQYIAFVDRETGECGERRLNHRDGEAEKTTVRTLGAASAKEHRQGGDSPKTGGAVVLDVAERLGVCAVGQVRFARGTARYRTWRELERRSNEWASRSLARGSLKK